MISKKLNEIFDVDNGIFKALIPILSFSWLPSTDAEMLDENYLYSHSGEKLSSMYVNKMLDKYPNDFVTKIATMISFKFKENWNREYLALVDAEYNPIENYDSHETRTPHDLTNTRTTKQKADVTRTNDGDVYGFNSDNSTPLNKVTETTTMDDTKNIVTDTNVESGYETTDRHGNIGVTTNQQMIIQEIELRIKFNMIDLIMNDIDSVIALPIY